MQSVATDDVRSSFGHSDVDAAELHGCLRHAVPQVTVQYRIRYRPSDC